MKCSALKLLAFLLVSPAMTLTFSRPMLAAPTKSSAKTAAPNTVLDYLLLLPDENYFEVPAAKRRQWLRDARKNGSLKPIIDLKNDYILFPGDGAQGTLQIVLFRYRGQVTVAVRDEWEEGRLDFLRYEKGRWNNVTRQVLPVRYNATYDYHLPQFGTTIRVTAARRYYKNLKIRADTGQRLYNLIWRDGKFHVQR